MSIKDTTSVTFSKTVIYNQTSPRVNSTATA